MAVTISQQPSAICSAGNPMTYTFTSSEATQPNFSYVVDIYVNGTKRATRVVFPEFGTISHYDVSPDVQPLIRKPQISSTIYSKSPSVSEVYIVVTESYGATPSLHSSSTSATCKAINMSLSDKEFVSINLVTEFQNKRFFTDNPTNEFVITRNCDVPLSRLENQPFQIDITTYNSNGVVLDMLTFQYVGSDYTVVDFNFNKANLISLGVVDFDSIAYFTVQPALGEIITFRYDDTCDKSGYSICWLNKYGAYEVYSMSHNRTFKTEITTHQYQRQFGQWENNGLVIFNYDSINSGVQTYLKIMKDKGELVSGVLTEEIANWLMSCFESPRVLLYDSNGDITYINISNKNKVDYQDRFNEDIINIEIEFEVNSQRKSILL